MELELMFSDQKWNILRSLSHEKLSPLQLAEKLNTTMANISQQLRLLEAANLVKKEKIKNRDKGKPRSLFSLTEDFAYIIPTMANFAAKRLLKATDHHRIILKIWFLENPELQHSIEKIYWKIEQYIDKTSAIAFNQSTKELIIITDKTDEIEKAIGKIKDLTCRVMGKEDAARALKNNKMPFSDSNELSIIYDRDNIFTKKMEAKR